MTLSLHSNTETPLKKQQSCITTSWDDGHPSDFRLAELLAKYNLRGTFYIPKTNQEHEVMPESGIQQIAAHFEVGGHTLDHIAVYETNAANWEQQVSSCYDWLSDLLGKKPVSFCFPKGQYTTMAAAAVANAGFRLSRTTELLQISADINRQHPILPTTIQVFEHTRTTYFKHLLKRGKMQSLLQWISAHAQKELELLTDTYIQKVVSNGGCFHLWGHSWEIDEYQLWNKLEAIFKRLSAVTDIRSVENRELLS